MARLRVSHLVNARLRYVTPTGLALEAGPECVVVWKVAAATAARLRQAAGQYAANVMWADNVDRLLLYLVVKAEEYGQPILALLNQSLMERLTVQRDVKVFIVDERLDLENPHVATIAWSDNDRNRAMQMHLTLVDRARSELLDVGSYFLTRAELRAEYEL
jgi:hypothetical protein